MKQIIVQTFPFKYSSKLRYKLVRYPLIAHHELNRALHLCIREKIENVLSTQKIAEKRILQPVALIENLISTSSVGKLFFLQHFLILDSKLVNIQINKGHIIWSI